MAEKTKTIDDLRTELFVRELKDSGRFREMDAQAEACSNISNLATAFSSLSEIDDVLQGGEELAIMKNQIFDALRYYCNQLPQIE